ncbi:MAG: STAS/SEC14 domain-containing protein [Rhodospirillales bacterium]|nr:STAS/SEC14 domain-containing protein [Rhodospirillales bacterium]
MIKHTMMDDGGKKWALLEIDGRLEVETSKQVIDQCDLIEKEHPQISIIIDGTEVTDLAVGPDDLLEIAQFFRQNQERQGRTALVTGPEDDRHVLGLIYEILVKDFEQRLVRVFKLREEAEAWLKLD